MGLRCIQESLANAKVSVRQQCVYFKAIAKKSIRRIISRNIMLKSRPRD